MDRETQKHIRERAIADLQRTREDLVKQRAKGGPMGKLAEASLIALGGSEQDGLLPWRGEFNELVWDEEKVGLASLYARQDVATVLAMQVPLMKLVGHIQSTAYLCVALLAYIAYRVS